MKRMLKAVELAIRVSWNSCVPCSFGLEGGFCLKALDYYCDLD
jgi:hypothetical protein